MKKTKALFSVFLSTSLLFGCSQNTGNESQSKDKDSEQEAAATASPIGWCSQRIQRVCIRRN